MTMLPGTGFDNMYGPAEVNGCTHYTIPGAGALNDKAIPIGPINEGMLAAVVDENGNEVPDGESGELLVATPTMICASIPQFSNLWRLQ